VHSVFSGHKTKLAKQGFPYAVKTNFTRKFESTALKMFIFMLFSFIFFGLTKKNYH